jgi:uncharacterized protein DUF6941
LRVECVLLCDAATLREGLLNVLGGGISQTTHPSFPATAQFNVAVRFVLEDDEVEGEHELVVRLDDPDGDAVQQLRARFTAPRPGGWALDEAAVSLPIGLVADLPKEGLYRVQIELDERALASLPLLAQQGEVEQRVVDRPAG